jgi:hypothetical protein
MFAASLAYRSTLKMAVGTRRNILNDSALQLHVLKKKVLLRMF